MNFEQLNCPACKEQYQQCNPPRLLTMCGHTFCHKCIKTLITKKKDKGFKVKCPIDKGCMQMQRPNPSLFPKNIVLIDLLNKTNASFPSNQFLDLSIIQKSANNLQKENFTSHYTNAKDLKHQERSSQQDKKLCLQHKKIMDVYCVKDCQLICTDCALFSQHKFHDVKNLAEMLKLESQKINQLLMVIQQKKTVQNNFLNKEIEHQIFDLLDKKKMIIQKQISDVFCDLRAMIDTKQVQIKQDLQEKMLITAEKIRDKIRIQRQTIQTFHMWEDQVTSMIQKEMYDSAQGLNERLSKMVKHHNYESQIKDGRQLIENIAKQQQYFINSIQHELDSLAFQSNIHVIQQAISRASIICQIQSVGNRLVKNYNQSNKKILVQPQLKRIEPQTPSCCQSNRKQQKQNLPFRQDDEEQSLLDFDTSFEPKPLRPSSFSCNNISVLSIKSQKNPLNEKPIQTKESKKKSLFVKRIDSFQILPKKRAFSITSSSSSLRSVSKIPKSPSTKSRQNQSSLKHQSLIDDITGNKIETVDLTGSELKPNELTLILTSIKNSERVKTVKLMRTKLDDSFIDKYFKYLLMVERVNLAQNKLTQESVDLILYILKANPGHKIKSLNMGQNRIVQRKNRKVLEDFNKLSINLVL